MPQPSQDPRPLISVVLCTYNGEKYLAEQLDSILNQTWKELEIVIVDDASTDNTRQLLASYSTQDNRIRLYANDTNLGFNKNFEKAISLASADYIAISDQDDIWERHKLERMMEGWPDGSLFIYSLSGNFTGSDFSNRRPAPPVYYSNIDDVFKLVFNSPVHGHACMFRKELFPLCQPFPSAIFYDWWMSMHAASTGVIGCIPETLTWHRVHESNSSRTLTSIEEFFKRNQLLREQSAFFLESFFTRPVARPEEKEPLLYYAGLLRKMDGKKFSGEMFRFIMRHRKRVFHYKRKSFGFFSHLKHAVRMARTGLI